MVPFVGEYRHIVDHKGRVIIPAKLRNNLKETVYLCKGFEDCLLILTPEEIEKIENKIEYDTLTNEGKRKFARAFFSSMIEVSFDSQGRILIPFNLKDYAKIKSEVVIVGTGFYIEIWEKNIWENNIVELDQERNKLAQYLEGKINGS
ncbi:MAG: division/cell wall cluster transcriptional repressor MraZ [Firmicutes bacterium]|nr:division/cell wall cluster transcriptional repressor MraZ [Bacillota bacterium]